MYDDRILPRGRDGIVIKTHLCNRNEFDRAIHLVRNPFDAIESYYHWKCDIQGDTDVAWEQHVRQSAAEWREHTIHWGGERFEGSRDRGIEESAYTLRYEDLRAAPAPELHRVLEWMGYELSQAVCIKAAEQAELGRMRKLHPTLGERFFREGGVGTGRAAFDHAMTDVMLSTLGDQLERFGYDRVRS